MKTFLYIRGNPGTGKITVGKIIEAKLGWKLFWFHDLKNTIFHIVHEHRIPRLMDEVTGPIIRHLLQKGENIIYIRPSPDQETVENIQRIVTKHKEYQFRVVRLTASLATLYDRVSARQDPYRITSKEDLESYLQERTMADIAKEKVISTDDLTPEQVANQVLEFVK